MRLSYLIAGLALSSSCISFAHARDQISIVGSSTVYPFATIAAEKFGQTSGFKTPVVESTGTGGGMKLFCGGIGVAFPDITNASRAMKSGEADNCAANGVEFIEIIVGNDGLAFSNSLEAKALDLTVPHIATALAAELPAGGKTYDKDAEYQSNALTTWAEVDQFVVAMGGEEANLPAKPISIMVPPPTSGTRDALGALFVEPGLDALVLKASDQLREDGRAIEMGENDSLIIEKLVADPDMFGVFGFSFLEQNRDKVQASVVNGVELSFENISTYDYPGARPLFFYIKKAHIGVIPGMKEFVTEFVSEKAMGLDGYLFPAGLVPLTDEETEAQIAKISDL